MRRARLVRLFWSFVEWLDVGVLALLVGFGVALVVVLLAGGRTAIQVALVVLLIVGMALHWMLTSSAGDKLRGRR
jgi:hypothetical protein